MPSLDYSRFDNLDTDSESDDGRAILPAKKKSAAAAAAVKAADEAVDDEEELELTAADVPAAWKAFTQRFAFPSENKLRDWAKEHRQNGVDENCVYIGDCPHLIWLMQPTDSEIEALEYDCLRRLYLCDVAPLVTQETEIDENGVVQLTRRAELPEVTAIAIELLRRYPGGRPGNWLRVHMWVFYSLLMDDDGFFAEGSQQLRQCWWERLEAAWGDWLYLNDADPARLKPLAAP
eukprot:TRINITY_DN56548_c0_g1_i2.p1 TRINITY_DN56548_c0_g1~~TRINITY_DN56548_c0_g1_i2.p1  ORF type:complete len:234 (-),score=63.67 TRINITY_DN56548_c0_g1_i2:65-766(-)